MEKFIEEEINRLRGLALIFAIPFQFIFFRPHVDFLILLPPAAFYLFFLFAGYQMTEYIYKMDSTFAVKDKIKTLTKYRVKRLVPVLLLWLIIANLCSYFFNSSGSFGPEHVVAKDSAAILAMSMNFLKSFAFNQEPSPYFNVLGTYWHLNFEEQYCLLCFILLLFTKKNRLLFTAVLTLISAFILRDIPIEVAPEISGYFNAFSFHKNLTHFLLGSLGYVMYAEGYSKRFLNVATPLLKWSGRFLIIGCLFYFIFFTASSSTMALTPFWLMEFVLILIISKGKVSFIPAGHLRAILDYIGSRFYELYLGHAIVLRFVEECSYRITGKLSNWQGLMFSHALLNSLLSLVLLIIVAEVIHRWTQSLRKS